MSRTVTSFMIIHYLATSLYSPSFFYLFSSSFSPGEDSSGTFVSNVEILSVQ